MHQNSNSSFDPYRGHESPRSRSSFAENVTSLLQCRAAESIGNRWLRTAVQRINPAWSATVYESRTCGVTRAYNALWFCGLERPIFVLPFLLVYPGSRVPGRAPSRIVQGITLSTTRRLRAVQGSPSKCCAASAALSARITRRTSGVPSKGPPRTTAPLASRSFINRAWAAHAGWSSSESEGCQAGPRLRITANMFIFGPDAHFRLYSGVTALFSRTELRTW